MQKQEVLYKCVTESAKLEVVEDITLSQNECLIETESGIYDCSVGTELQELKKQLLLLCYQ
jgi:flagellar assembly protein FliH